MVQSDDRIGPDIELESQDQIRKEQTIFSKNNHCPYCRSDKNLLPLVNGIKIIDKNIHNLENINTYENIKCNTILKTGKNKGNNCGKFCKLGYFTCNRHTQMS